MTAETADHADLVNKKLQNIMDQNRAYATKVGEAVTDYRRTYYKKKIKKNNEILSAVIGSMIKTMGTHPVEAVQSAPDIDEEDSCNE